MIKINSTQIKWGMLCACLSLCFAVCLFFGCGNGIDVQKASPVLSSASVLCSSNSAATTELLAGMPRPEQRTGIGNSHLRITTEQEEAKYWFNQGLNYLHGFWYLEAYRAFEQVLTLDPKCAMGYWGIAMCQPGFGGDDFVIWQNAISRAAQLSGGCTPVEKRLIEAVEITAYHDLLTARPNWESLARDFPQEPEAVAFASIMLRQLVQTEQDFDAVKAMLEQALQRFPDHVGLLHYYVHLLEVRPDFYLAKAAAERLPIVAPHNSHLTHMPGHIYFLEGAYEKAALTFEAARTQEQAYHLAQGIAPVIDQNYLHNLHYLSIVYSELNKQEKALAIAEEFASITLRQAAPIDGAGWMLLYEGRILPALVHIRFGEYAQAAKKINFWLTTPLAPLENDLVREYLTTIQHYCYAMDFALQNDVQRAVVYAEEMVVHFQRFDQLAMTKPESGELILTEQAFDIMNMMRYELAGWLNNMDATQPFRDDEWELAEQIEQALPYDEPPRLMYPVAESRARIHLRRGEQELARQEIDQALKRRPKSPRISSLLPVS